MNSLFTGVTTTSNLNSVDSNLTGITTISTLASGISTEFVAVGIQLVSYYWNRNDLKLCRSGVASVTIADNVAEVLSISTVIYEKQVNSVSAAIRI